MADYYPLIARAVAGLDKSTGDARRTLYERARGALVQQLRGVTPALSESDITRERLALEEAIRKVEAEAVRKARMESRPEGPPKVRAPDAARWEKVGRMNGPAGAAAPVVPEDAEPPPRKPSPTPPRPEEFLRSAMARRPDEEAAPAAELPDRQRPPLQAKARTPAPDPAEAPCADPAFERPADEAAPGMPPATPLQLRPNRPPRTNGERRGPADYGLKDFRPGLPDAAETAELPPSAPLSPPLSPGKLARSPFAPEPAPPEPAAETPLAEPQPPRSPPGAPTEFPGPAMAEPGYAADDALPPLRPPPAPIEDELVAPRPPRSYRGVVRSGIALALLGGLGVVVWQQWPAVSDLYGSLRAPATPESKTDAPPSSSRVKIPDRIEPGGQPSQPQTGVALAPGGAPAAVAQRVILYEEDTSSSPPVGKQYVGSVIWRTERVSPGAGKPAEVAVRADAEIPERKLSVIWSLRRDTEPGLSTSHTIEVMFKLPPDFPAGGISNVPGIMMKQAEQAYGAPLAANSVKVTNAYFIIGLHAQPVTTRDHNIQMLKERAWLDIPIVYANGRRAILVFEKGNPGERAFNEAFAAWRQ